MSNNHCLSFHPNLRTRDVVLSSCKYTQVKTYSIHLKAAFPKGTPTAQSLTSQINKKSREWAGHPLDFCKQAGRLADHFQTLSFWSMVRLWYADFSTHIIVDIYDRTADFSHSEMKCTHCVNICCTNRATIYPHSVIGPNKTWIVLKFCICNI